MADPAARTVADATVVITDEQLESILDFALELQHGRDTAEGISLMKMCTPALLQELLERRRAMAAIQRLAQVDNVFDLVQRCGADGNGNGGAA